MKSPSENKQNILQNYLEYIKEWTQKVVKYLDLTLNTTLVKMDTQSKIHQT